MGTLPGRHGPSSSPPFRRRGFRMEPNPLGNQIFITLRRGKEWPPTCTDVRVKYEETIGDLKKKVFQKIGVPPENLLLFWHNKELRSDLYDHLTLYKLRVHTGFGFNGYDTRVEPDFWPPVQLTPKGLHIKTPITDPEYLIRHPDAINDPEVLNVELKEIGWTVPIKQDPKWLTESREVKP